MRNGLRAAEVGEFRVPGRFETSPYETIVEAVQPPRFPCYSASRAKILRETGVRFDCSMNALHHH